jgi:hypothetical protein
VHVPTHLVEVAKALGLRNWVKKRGFPTPQYFSTVDDCKRMLARHANPERDDPNNEAIVAVLAEMLNNEGILATHVLSVNTYISIGDTPEQRWKTACTAAGWVVLQAYDLACKTGKWPPT